MSNKQFWQDIESIIQQSYNPNFHIEKISPVSGGCINSAYSIADQNICYFVKLNRADLEDMFQAEFAGLEEMHRSHSIKIPEPLLAGSANGQAFLILEHLQLCSGNSQSDSLLGQQLAQMHALNQPCFGWHRDNTIGSTVQINQQSHDWVEFWSEHRLGFQLSLAESQGYACQLIHSGQCLIDLLTGFFAQETIQPSLLHGDLWSGNAAMTQDGQPVLFDPACYYGDREADIAMTELFGGFSQNFYAAYNNVLPLSNAYPVRKKLYNLYHILNHLNLFGGGYLSQAQSMIDSLIAEIR